MVLFRMLNCQRVALWLRQRQESPPGLGRRAVYRLVRLVPLGLVQGYRA